MYGNYLINKLMCEIMEIKPLGPECSFYEFVSGIFSSKTLVYI